MKNILFFIDPLIDNGNLLFRMPTLRHHVPIFYGDMKRHVDAGNVDVRIIASDALIRQAQAEGIGSDWPLVCLPAQELAGAFAAGEVPAAVWQQETYSESHVEHYREAFCNALGDFVPDVVIAYETCAPYFKKIYPEALVVFEAWGAFSRAPAPALTILDPSGTYQNSTLYKDMEKIRAIPVTGAKRDTMNAIRNMVAGPFVTHDPCYSHVLGVRANFRKVILFPLQIDDYYSFSETSGYRSHVAMLEDVFNTLPSDIGVIVTHHQNHKPVLDDARIASMRKRYRNFIYFDDLTSVPMLSSFMVHYVDGVITVSSAVAFHAALMQVPTFIIGKSHASVISSGNPSDVARVLDETPLVDFDGAMHWMLTHYQVFTEAEQTNADNFLMVLDGMGKMRGEGMESFPCRYTDSQLLDLFARHSRQSQLTKLLKDRKIPYINNELYSKIVEAKIVSYDLFDTLVERPFIEPHYLFQLIEPRVRRLLGISTFQFMSFRRIAEAAARKERGGKETTLDSIYRHFRLLTGLSEHQCAEIAKMELDCEKLVLQRRDPIYQTMRFAKKLGKVVTIITDIYLEEPHIREILDCVNIREFDHLMVSATEDKRKHDGTIYPEYLSRIYRDYRISPNGRDILHIGDNAHADSEMAHPYKIRSHVLPKAIDNFKRSRWGNVFEQNFRRRHVTADVLAGVIANRFDYSLSGDTRETLFANSLFRVGYAAAGPMLFSFVQWLVRQVREAKYERVCFLARDGYLLKVIYDKIREERVYSDLPPSSYLHVSRRAAAVPAISSWEDIVDLYHLTFGNRKIGDFIESRFGLSKDKIGKAVLAKHNYSVNDVIYQGKDVKRHLSLLADLANDIIANAQVERRALKRHLSDNGIETGRENVCLVDIGYSGSIQKYLNKVYDGAKMAGYYMLTHEQARRSFDGIVCEGFYSSYDEHRMADRHPLNDFVFLFESVLSSQEGSVVRHAFDDDGNWTMVTKGTSREMDRLAFMRQVHAGVSEFAHDLIRAVGPYLDDVPFGAHLGSKPFFHMAKFPTRQDALLFAGLQVDNGFGGGDAWLVYDAKSFIGKDGMLSGKALDVALGSSQWKEAAAAAYAKPRDEKGDVKPSACTQSIDLMGVRVKDLDLPKPVRKYLKFRRNPYRFFADSANPLARTMRIFYRRYKDA